MDASEPPLLKPSVRAHLLTLAKHSFTKSQFTSSSRKVVTYVALLPLPTQPDASVRRCTFTALQHASARW